MFYSAGLVDGSFSLAQCFAQSARKSFASARLGCASVLLGSAVHGRAVVLLG